jgi:hypothetical protein
MNICMSKMEEYVGKVEECVSQICGYVGNIEKQTEVKHVRVTL